MELTIQTFFCFVVRQDLSLNNMEPRFDKINKGLLEKVWEYKTRTKKERTGKSALLQRPTKADLELTKIHLPLLSKHWD